MKVSLGAQSFEEKGGPSLRLKNGYAQDDAGKKVALSNRATSEVTPSYH
jgi:hypothetical protein